MLAYHNDQAVKQKYLDRVAAHRSADQLVQSYGYWKDGKGCAVGCTIHGSSHAAYETEIGVPKILARLEDAIFEGLPHDDAQLWPERFLTAIVPGMDLSCVGWKLLHWLLTDNSVNPGIDHPIVKDAVKRCSDLMADLSEGREGAASAAWSAAASAAWSAAWQKIANKLIELIEAA